MLIDHVHFRQQLDLGPVFTVIVAVAVAACAFTVAVADGGGAGVIASDV